MFIGRIKLSVQRSIAVLDGICHQIWLSDEKYKIYSKKVYVPIALAVVFLTFFSPNLDGFVLWSLGCLIGILTSCGILIYCGKKKKVLLADKKFCLISVFSASMISLSHRHDLAERVFRRTSFLCSMLKINVSSIAADLCNLAIMISGTVLLFFVFVVFTYFFYKWFYRHAKSIAKEFSSSEKKELMFFWLLYIILITLSYLKTYVFYNISYPFIVDIVYTSDTGLLYETNTWLVLSAPENDIRQPLFALFSAPFCVLPYFISGIFFFIPNLYAYLMAFTQAFIILSSLLIICRIVMESSSVERMLLFAMLSTTFPVFLFITNMEQYAFALFWVVVYLYLLCVKNTSKRGLQFPLVAAAGSIMTSWILLLTTWTRGKLLENIRYCIKTVVLFLVLCIVFFRVSVITGAVNRTAYLLGSFSTLSAQTNNDCDLYHRIIQFSNFVYSCVFAPESTIVVNRLGHWSYQMCELGHIKICGIFFFCFAMFGFWVSRKKTIAKVSLLWIALSVLLLLVIGYGTVENGTVLYTLYFSWAYYILMFFALCRIIPLYAKLRLAVFGGIVILQTAINFPAIIRTIQFGIHYYPAR